jgi:Zn-dependent peptidase ImmA (M78 family)/DNA-binding XRE family transcriptional regulator
MNKENEALYFGKRLKTARKMAGLSMDDLAHIMGRIVTKQAIGKYELGKMKPTSKVIIRLAQALKVKPEYFFRSSVIELSQLNFRKRFKFRKNIEESLKYKTIDLLERYKELEEILGLSIKFEEPFLKCNIKNQNDVEQAAENLRRKWGLGNTPIMYLLKLLEEKGIKILFMDDFDGFDGLSADVGDSKIIVLNKSHPPDRLRFTAAHELAHILCKFPENSKTEKLCHSFAGAFLLPKEMMEEVLLNKRSQITFWELKVLKENYGISMQAIMNRAYDLDIISENYLQNFKSYMRKKNWRKEEPVKYCGKEEPFRFKQLLFYAVSEEIISFSKAADLWNMSISEFREEFQAEL